MPHSLSWFETRSLGFLSTALVGHSLRPPWGYNVNSLLGISSSLWVRGKVVQELKGRSLKRVTGAGFEKQRYTEAARWTYRKDKGNSKRFGQITELLKSLLKCSYAWLAFVKCFLPSYFSRRICSASFAFLQTVSLRLEIFWNKFMNNPLTPTSSSEQQQEK